MIDEFLSTKEALKKYNKVLVRGNPSHKSFTNGYSILDTYGNIQLSELSWSDVIQYLKKLELPMDELEFYKLLQQHLWTLKTNEVTEKLFNEVKSRLNKLQQKEKINKWNKLCLLIEDTTKKYEKENKELVDISIDIEDNIITITNNLYSEV